MARPVIAVINEDPTFLSLLDEFLTDEGFNPVCQRRFQNTSDMIRQIRPQLLILDSWFTHPNDGTTMLRGIRQDAMARDVPVILTSTDARSVQEQPIVKLDPHCDVLPEPFDLNDLLKRVCAALKVTLPQHSPISKSTRPPNGPKIDCLL